jgi:hypothetical protein
MLPIISGTKYVETRKPNPSSILKTFLFFAQYKRISLYFYCYVLVVPHRVEVSKKPVFVFVDDICINCQIEGAAMAEWLCYLARTTKALPLNLGATRHRTTLDKSLMAVCLGSPWMLHTDYVWHTLTLVASQYVRGAQVIERRNSGSGWPSVQSYS